MIYPYEIKKAAEGNLEAIEQICAATWEPLYRFIYAKVQNREEAEDITQETYFKTLVYLREHKSLPENLQGYMKTIALNIVRDRWRQKKRRGTQVIFEVEAVVEVNDGPVKKVYLKRLVRKDETGIWSVVGYDPL